MFSKTRQFGNSGEEYAAQQLEKLGFTVLERNYRKQYGEIDIVARGTDGSIHFVEVKTQRGSIDASKSDVSRGTFFPEENVTREKLLKIERTIHTWIHERSYEGDWFIDVMAITLDEHKRVGKYRFIRSVY